MHTDTVYLRYGRYVTFCSPSLTGQFGLFQNAGELDHIHLFHDCNSTVVLMALAVYVTFFKALSCLLSDK